MAAKPGLAGAAVSQAASLFWASPSGGSGVMSARGIVQADLPKVVAYAATALTDAATVALDASLGNLFTLLLGGNRTLGVPTNPTAGQRIMLLIKQPSSGGPWTLNMTNAVFRYGTDLTAVTWTATASKMDRVLLEYHGVDTKWDVLAQQHGF